MTERLTAEELAEYRKIAATQMVLLSREDANKLLDAAEEAERLRAAIAEHEKEIKQGPDWGEMDEKLWRSRHDF